MKLNVYTFLFIILSFVTNSFFSVLEFNCSQCGKFNGSKQNNSNDNNKNNNNKESPLRINLEKKDEPEEVEDKKKQ